MIDLGSPFVVLMEKMGRHEAIACLFTRDSLDRVARCEHAQHGVCARRATIANQAHGDVRTN